MYSLVISLSFVRSSPHRVPPKVQWEGHLRPRGRFLPEYSGGGPHDRGAGYLSPQHYTLFNNKQASESIELLLDPTRSQREDL